MAQQKWNLGDIRPAAERSARPRTKSPMQDVVPPSAYSAPVHTAVSLSEEDMADHDEYQMAEKTTKRKLPRGKRMHLIVIAIVLFFGIGFLATLFLQGAEITVYPKSKAVTVQATLSAYQQPNTGTLGYELLTLEETGERTVDATGSEEVEELAKGEITIYNTFSSEPQRLIKSTRFEAKDGHVFRIADSVVIPGYTTNASKEKVPGTLTTRVSADGTGDSYNIAPTRFTIPGLKGSPQFDTMYAESKASMQGGFKGTRLIVEASVLASSTETIKLELKDKLLARLKSEQPAGFIVYSAGARIRFSSLPSESTGDKQATLKEHAVLEAPMFADADFARYVAQNTVVGYQNEDVRIEDPQSLAFSYASSSVHSEPMSWNKIDFSLAGTAKIVWTYDQEKLRQLIVGASKSDLTGILLKYQPAIERATTVIRPFWKQSFPKDAKKIKIIEVIDTPKE